MTLADLLRTRGYRPTTYSRYVTTGVRSGIRNEHYSFSIQAGGTAGNPGSHAGGAERGTAETE